MAIQKTRIEVATLSTEAQSLAVQGYIAHSNNNNIELGNVCEGISMRLENRDIEPEEAVAALILAFNRCEFKTSVLEVSGQVKRDILDLDEHLKDVNLKLDNDKMFLCFHVLSEVAMPGMEVIISEMIRAFQIINHPRRNQIDV